MTTWNQPTDWRSGHFGDEIRFFELEVTAPLDDRFIEWGKRMEGKGDDVLGRLDLEIVHTVHGNTISRSRTRSFEDDEDDMKQYEFMHFGKGLQVGFHAFPAYEVKLGPAPCIDEWVQQHADPLVENEDPFYLIPNEQVEEPGINLIYRSGLSLPEIQLTPATLLGSESEEVAIPDNLTDKLEILIQGIDTGYFDRDTGYFERLLSRLSLKEPQDSAVERMANAAMYGLMNSVYGELREHEEFTSLKPDAQIQVARVLASKMYHITFMLSDYADHDLSILSEKISEFMWLQLNNATDEYLSSLEEKTRLHIDSAQFPDGKIKIRNETEDQLEQSVHLPDFSIETYRIRIEKPEETQIARIHISDAKSQLYEASFPARISPRLLQDLADDDPTKWARTAEQLFDQVEL